MQIRTVVTTPYDDQQPGTAGLRKKVAVFQQPGYLENFVQSLFDTVDLPPASTLVLGGDGRFLNTHAIQIILRMAAANGVRHFIVGQHGWLSTPAASHLVRERGADGGFLLTASHNPGGPDGDFGIKFSLRGGAQAPGALMEAVYQRSRELDRYLIADLPDIDLARTRELRQDGLRIDVIDPVLDYIELMQRLFDFERLRELLTSSQFRMNFDAMHAITGPYARAIFERELGAPEGTVMNASPLEDFGGGHPDPNPVDAHELVALICSDDAPDFAAASDGDGDRNMVLGRGFLVSPGDSLAVLAANARHVPGYRDGLAGVARSMPTSRAVDRVATELGIPCYETPTGWRFFSNLLEAGRITLCGEESFGTGSNHVREKDGLWAVLFWLNLVAVLGQPVADIVRRHWATFGRDFFARHDYFIEQAASARDLMGSLATKLDTLAGKRFAQQTVAGADSFTYQDPVDGSVAEDQGIRVYFDDARVVYRLSGTGTGGATLRVYLEHYVAQAAQPSRDRHEVLAPLAAASRELAAITRLTGLEQPTAIV